MEDKDLLILHIQYQIPGDGSRQGISCYDIDCSPVIFQFQHKEG